LAKKVTITLDDDVLVFIDKQATDNEGKANRSAFINKILKEAKKEYLEEELKLAYQRDTADKSYREEVALWDVVVGDGIE
jgi:metal-responsive CopG/Arc/MetJ family transcriptional regulator